MDDWPAAGDGHAVHAGHADCQLHATILTALGLNFDDLGYEISGRVERLTGVAGTAQVIPGVLA